MAITVPTREELFQAFIDDYKGAFPEKNASRGSDGYRLGRVVSGANWVILAKLLYFEKNALPDTAIGSFLDRWGKVYSFPRIQPQGSTGTEVLTVTGTAGTAIPEGSELSHADGTLYEVSTAAVIGPGGDVDVSIAATSTGEATNKGADEILTFTTPITDVDAEATLIAALDGGTDLESDAKYAVRLLAHIGDPPEGGAVHDYLEWALSRAGVESAFVWTHRRGKGTVDIGILGPGTGADRICSADVVSDVQDYIDGVTPANVADFLVLDCEAEEQDVTVTIEIDETVYGWDWDDLGTGYTITAHSEGSSTITVPTAPVGVVAGVRIQVRGEEALVTDRTGNVLTLSFEDDHDGNPVDWFTFTVLDATDTIRASGDLVRPVRDAIIDLFNTLGPAKSDYSRAALSVSDASLAAGMATNWTSDLKISKLYAAITDVPGVDDATISTPAATASPTEDDYESAIFFLVPGNIRVLKP